MELGLGFADDDLKRDNKDEKICLTSYNAKICHPKWFLSAEGEDNESRANIKKYQADYHYGNKNYKKAAQHYIEAIGFLSSQNRVMRKAMMESLSRCYCYTCDETNAAKLVDELMADATTTDNVVQVMLLKQRVLNHFGRLQEEIETIQQLICYHPYNVQFWLMLMRAYRKLLVGDSHSQGLTNNTAAVPTDSVTIQNFDEKLENMTIDRSDLGNAQSVSNESKDKQLSVDGIVEHFVENLQCSSGYDKISQESSIPSQIPSKDCAHKPHISETVEDTTIQNDEARSEPPTSVHYKLLTCCIGARLLLKSVEGTVASFIKTRNQELLQQVEQIQDDLQLEKSVVQTASEHMIHYFYQSNNTEDDGDDDDIGSWPQQSNKVTAGDGDNFDEKWFGWIKKL